VSERIAGEDGPLAEYGLVPLPENEADEVQNAVKNETTMGM
jgi:phosphate transport system substrate-binding protein